ncbi:cytochrome c oxidase subunit 3, partial [uncultured Methylobacterium sp.]
MAEAHGKHHDYHLVNPSPWPLVGSMSGFVMTSGAVLWMKSLTIANLAVGPYVFFAGLIGILYTMLSWWRDVAHEANTGDHTRVVQLSHRYGMIMFIASEVMFFVAWFWAYFEAALYTSDPIQASRVEFTGGLWPPKGVEAFDPWHLPLLNTLILLTSGTTITWAHHALLNNDRKGMKYGLWLTIALGVLFSFVQAYEYGHAHFGFSGSIYSATFFMATGFHGAHVIIGTIFLAVCLYRL